MMVGTQEHDDLIAQFKRDFRSGYRLDVESREMWKRGHVFQNGETNDLFFAYLKGYALGKAVHRS